VWIKCVKVRRASLNASMAVLSFVNCSFQWLPKSESRNSETRMGLEYGQGSCNDEPPPGQIVRAWWSPQAATRSRARTRRMRADNSPFKPDSTTPVVSGSLPRVCSASVKGVSSFPRPQFTAWPTIPKGVVQTIRQHEASCSCASRR
jgi:hypothetical protein